MRPNVPCTFPSMRSGFTLVELCVVLALIALGLSAALPVARRQIDRMAVLSAREAAIGQVTRARREARLSGGAALELRREGSRLWVEPSGASQAPPPPPTPTSPPDTLRLEQRFGVRLEMTSAVATLAFDALGVGRLANRTLAFVRGDQRAALTISAYGRVRRTP